MNITDRLLENLRRDELSLGVAIRLARTVEIAKAIRACHMDWLFIDLEHSAMSIDMAAQISIASLDVGITPLVRVPKMALTLATRALDNGAMGIVMPHVDSAGEARAIATALRFAPAGHRSYTSSLPHFNFQPPPIAEAMAVINRETTIAVMVETPESVDNIEAIAAVPGIDILLVGGTDLSIEMGVPGEFGNPRMHQAFALVAAAARRHGKFLGIAGVSDEQLAHRYVAMGARMVLAGVDLAFMMEAALNRSQRLRSLSRHS